MAIYDNYRLRFNTALNSLEMNVGGEDWELVPSGAGGDITANDITLDGQLVQDTTYADAPSFQGLAGDTTLAAGAGRDKGDGGSFQAAIMGNIHGSTLTKTGNFVAGVIGAYDIQSTNASELPKAGVLGSIFDGSTTADGCVVAEIDGSDPSSVTRAGAAFKARQLNTNAGSGVDYGVDLHDTAVSGYMSSPTLPLAIAKAALRLNNEVCWLNGSAAPTNGVTGATFAGIGSLYTRTSNGVVYSNTGTKASPTWTVLAAGGTPGGNDKSVQYNNSGSFGGDDSIQIYPGANPSLEFNSDGNSTIIWAPANMLTNLAIIEGVADGSLCIGSTLGTRLSHDGSAGTPAASATLDIVSTTKGVLFPRMTTTQRDNISSPAEGLVIYNSTTHVLNFYNGTVWGAV